ncbi:MAG TPA: YceI family protein [Bacteroidia bacterium]|jgi:polyisoprenoid-binding protein YceI|nr:YceI family protein [Bacteroidia bacterium]
MKLLNNKTLLVLLVLISGYGYIISCTRENDLITPIQLSQPFVSSRGVNVHLPGNMTTGNTNEWKLDKVHSSVLWSSNYVGAAGLLTGRFNQFGMHDVTNAKAISYVTAGQPLLDSSWAFYENEPAKSYFNGYVQINTSNTGEPGRDAGCNISGMGTVAIVAGTQNLAYPNLAKIKTTEIKFDPESNGYIVTLNLTYQGKLTTPLTKSIIGTLKYIPRATPTGATYDVFGLQLKFQFNCRDFGIVSTSIADKIDIECNMNFNNK